MEAIAFAGWGSPIGLGFLFIGFGFFSAGGGVFFWGLYWLRRSAK